MKPLMYVMMSKSKPSLRCLQCYAPVSGPCPVLDIHIKIQSPSTHGSNCIVILTNQLGSDALAVHYMLIHGQMSVLHVDVSFVI